jgi:hypothetical protein
MRVSVRGLSKEPRLKTDVPYLLFYVFDLTCLFALLLCLNGA